MKLSKPVFISAAVAAVALLAALFCCTAAYGQNVPASYQADFNLDQNAWNTCGACGNSGGGGALAQYGATVGTTQFSEDGFDTQCWLVPNGPYQNAYFWQEHPAPSGSLLYLEYEFDLFIPQGQELAPQAIEFEFQHKLNGWIYNGGWQIDYAEGAWRTFDFGAQTWKATNIPFEPFTANTWHHIAAEYHTDSASHTVFFDSLSVDGHKYWLNIWHPAFLSSGPNKLTNAFQLDGNATATPYSVFVDKMTLRVVSEPMVVLSGTTSTLKVWKPNR